MTGLTKKTRNIPKYFTELNDKLMEVFVLDRPEAATLLTVITGKSKARAAQWLGSSMRVVTDANDRLYTIFSVKNDYELIERVLNDGAFKSFIRERKTDRSASRGRKIK